MVGSDENFTSQTRPSSIQGELRPLIGGKINGGGMDGGAGGPPRRALSNINKNIIGAPAPYPCLVVRKRGVLTQKDPISNKIPPIPVHRPITRKLAAQIANKKHQKSHPLIQKEKQGHKSIPNDGNVLVEEDSIISDVENYKTSDEYHVPMSVQHTEALLEEIDRMDDEIEMKDITDEPIEDIDSIDKKNPLAVVEYIDDIYSYYRKSEKSGCVQPNYMEQQFDINERMRAILIDWLIEVHYKFELMEETLYLTVNLIDRFLALETIVRKKLQLVGITAMLIACKYEEVFVPVVEDFILISDKAYTRQEVLDMESLMINTLQFNLSVPTPYVFMRRFLKAAESDKKMEFLSYFIIELCLVEYEMLKFPPSLLAAAAIFTAQCSVYGSKKWTKTCEIHTHYTEQQLLECAKIMVNVHQKSGTGKLTGVYKKYCTSKYGYAAKSSEPAIFLMDGEDEDEDDETRIIQPTTSLAEVNDV